MNKFSPIFLCCYAIVFAVAAHGTPILSIDLNDQSESPDDIVPGFERYVLSDETLNVSIYGIDVNPAGGAVLDDLHRTTPTSNATLTLGALYRDSIHAIGDNTANFYRVGIDTLISGLTKGKKYTVTAWSYDSGSAGTRTSDWSIVGLGGPSFGANNYTFDGTTSPASNAANSFSITSYADENGRLLLRGRQGAASTVAQVFLNGFTVEEHVDQAVTPTQVLALDFNQRAASGPPNTQTGFQEFILNGSGAQTTATTRTFGAITATLAPVSGSMDDRNRTTPVNSGAFTNSLLLRDFVFGTGTAGLDLRIQGLAANRTYLVELWSFDSTSTGPRASDWTVNSAPLWDDYLFNGSNLPSTNDDYKMSGVFSTNASGELLLSGRLVTGSPAVFLNALRVSEMTPAAIVDLGHPILSEFLASNSDGITDEDGDASDWIEIWNTTAEAIDLAGWRLTNDITLPAKWEFPNGLVLPSQSRIVVWASEKNRRTSPAALHTNFNLNKAAGEYLALSKSDGTIVSSYSNLPAQFADISYGLTGTSQPLTQGYFQPPSPGSPNGIPAPGFVADTTFTAKRGYYAQPFNVQIACATPGAQIFYTIDGSEPTTNSIPYPGAAGVPITTTTVLRAKAFAPPLAPSNTDTQTYLFTGHVKNQPANPAGWPMTWGTNSEVAANNGGNGTVSADYEMDPAVVNVTQPGHGVEDGLNALAALSIVLNPADFHSSGNGIYTNPQNVGDAWERAASIELLELDGTGTHTICGIRMHGNSSRRPFRMQKHSFRLAFRNIYGDGKLDYKLFADTTVKSFNKLVLHAFFTDGWGLVSWDSPRYRPHDSVYFRDAWMKKSFSDMGHARVSSRYVHLYINGLYWGVYAVGERIDDTWCADHFGGLTTDYDLIAPGEATYVRAGTASAWDSLFALVNSSDFTQPANHNAVAAQVDLANFADYYLLHVHADAEDWPHHNGYAVRNRNLAGSKWQFVVWDQEIALDPTVNVDRLSNNAPNTTLDKTPGRLYQRLKTSAEFRLLFADRAHKHLHNNGALSLAAEQARWQGFADQLDKAIVAESARWGDTADATPYGTAVPAGKVFTRESDWLPTVASVKNSHLPNLHNTANSFATITELRSQGLYPNTESPTYGKFGGNVPVGYTLTMTAPGSAIYYTTDGTDPREAFTGTARGTLYSTPITLTQTCTIKARARNGSEWSALTEANFIVGTAASNSNLAVTELNYNPANADHEFIELANISAGTVNLTGVHFEGITFTFPTGTLLAPSERIVVVRNQAAFNVQYGNGPRVAGQYTGALDNNGEEIAVIDANGADIVRFTYTINSPWPTAPAFSGRSLVLRSPISDPRSAVNWRSSTAVGGSPGGNDSVSFTGNPLVDGDHDGSPALLEYVFGTNDTAPDSAKAYSTSIEHFLINGESLPFLTLTSLVANNADSATVTAEFSSDLITWDGSASSVVYLGETLAPNGLFTRKWRVVQPFTNSNAGRQFLRIRVQLQ